MEDYLGEYSSTLLKGVIWGISLGNVSLNSLKGLYGGLAWGMLV